jgi:hypothetical protein
MTGTASAGTASADRYHPSVYEPPFTAAWAAPVLTADPSFGRPGTEVRITGATFHRGIEAFFGTEPMPIFAANQHEIYAMIPWHARGQSYIFTIDYAGHARTDDMFAIERRHGRHYHRW